VLELILFFLGISIVAALPYEILLPWLLQRYREITTDIHKKQVFCSKIFLVAFLRHALSFAIGYASLYLVENSFANEYLLLLCVGLVLFFHNWSPFTKLKNKMNLFFVIWGVYTFFMPWLSFIFPITYFVLALIFNSFLVGQVLSIIMMFISVWYFDLEPIYFLINSLIFLIVFLSFGNRLLRHVERKSDSILHLFLNRNLPPYLQL
jgi:glycerol-3-phosphate acyltransferase PlsY